ncbi:MAG TPA: hypothetical protein HPP97_08510 [Desulfuromonadales bacterium]|nr:hypothetical protein [Desulfuromonadales bacterium]
MDVKFSNDSGITQQEVPAEKKKQRALVLLLLILISGFTYLYFFTGLIKPQEVQKAVEAPAAPVQIVKIPLPPRDGMPAQPKGQPAAASEAPKAVVSAAAPVVKPVAAPSAPARPVALPAATPSAKAAATPPPLKAKEESKKSAEVTPAEKRPLPISTADKKQSTGADAKVETKKAVQSERKSVSEKDTVKKNAVSSASKARVDVHAKPVSGGSWSIIVGDYVLEEALSADLGRVRKSGLEPVVKPGSRKITAMNRLLLSEFNDRASAQAALEKLQRHTSDAFVIDQGGKLAVYAGSYLKSEAADSEKERLKAVGFATTLKHMDLAIPSQTLTVGPFASKKAADAARSKLQSSGLKATVSQP